MKFRYFALCLGIAAATSYAADAPQPQRAAPVSSAIAIAKATGKAQAMVVASPVVMQTSAIVNADGSVSMVCEQTRNPHPVQIQINKQFLEPQQ